MRSTSTSTACAHIAARRRHAGFTLMELLTAIAVIAVLLSIAVPSIAGLMHTSRVASQMNGFLADLHFARDQAVVRGQSVSVCASADSSTCAGGAQWQRGWIVFADLDGDGRRNANGEEALLRAQPAWPSDDRFIAAGDVAAISFARSGYSRGMKSSRTVLTLRAPGEGAKAIRCVVVDLAGHAAVLQPGSADCA